jgi:8-oxo-dGTP pyrophosphatase MutT (NUDIX family)
MLSSLDPPRARLLAALHAHAPLDAEEAAHRDAITAFVQSEPGCFERTTYAPGHLTGSAFVVCRRTGKVVLHHHRRLGRWLQMGGHDDGESDPAATALREAREESGLSDLTFLSEGILDLDVHSIPAARGEPPHLHHDVRYALATEVPEEIRRDDAESLALEWFTLEDAARAMGEHGARRALSRIARLLRRTASA